MQSADDIAASAVCRPPPVIGKLFPHRPVDRRRLFEPIARLRDDRELSPPAVLERTEHALTLCVEVDDELAADCFTVDPQGTVHRTLVGDQTYREYLAHAKTLDFAVFRQHPRFLTTRLMSRNNTPVVFVDASVLDLRAVTPDALYFYLISRLDAVADRRYSVVFLNKAGTLPLRLCKRLYAFFPRKYHKNIERLFLVAGPSVHLRLATTLVPRKTLDKLTVVAELYELYKTIPAGCYPFPAWVRRGFTQAEHPLFGLPLSEACAHPYRGTTGLPFVLDCVVQYFARNSEAFEAEGIFRLSGTKEVVEAYVDAFNHCRVVEIPAGEDPHNVTSILKTYLRALPEPLLTEPIGQGALSLFKLESSDEVLRRELKRLLLQVPTDNRRVMLTIINLAQLALSHQDKNRMDKTNLGTIFGPYIFWADLSADAMGDTRLVNLLFTYLITNIAEFIEVLF